MSAKEDKVKNREDAQQQVAPQSYPVYVYPEEERLYLREYWELVVDYKYLIGKIVAACTVLSIIFALILTPIYRAETLLAPAEEGKGGGLSSLVGQFGGLAELAGIQLGGGGNIQESIATLNSRALTDIFIKEEGLMPVLFVNDWDREKNIWNYPEDPPTAWEAYKMFNESIRFVDVNKKTNLITLAVEWKDPVLAAEWANKLVKRVNTERRQEAIREAEKSIKFLEEQIGKTSSLEVQQSIYKLIEAQTKTKMIASTREEYAFKVIDPAVAPEEKERPKRRLIVVLGFMFGCTIGFIAAFIIRFQKKQKEQNIASDDI